MTCGCGFPSRDSQEKDCRSGLSKNSCFLDAFGPLMLSGFNLLKEHLPASRLGWCLRNPLIRLPTPEASVERTYNRAISDVSLTSVVSAESPQMRHKKVRKLHSAGALRSVGFASAHTCGDSHHLRLSVQENLLISDRNGIELLSW